MINAQNYDSSYYDFLLNQIKGLHIQNPEDYVAEHFYSQEEQSKLNEVAVNLMLRCIGVLK